MAATDTQTPEAPEAPPVITRADFPDTGPGYAWKLTKNRTIGKTPIVLSLWKDYDPKARAEGRSVPEVEVARATTTADPADFLKAASDLWRRYRWTETVIGEYR